MRTGGIIFVYLYLVIVIKSFLLMKKIFILVALIFVTSINSEGQVMILKNKKHHKNIIFKKGDAITYILKGDGAYWKSGTIDSFDSTFLTVSNVIVKVNNIAAIEVQRKRMNFAQDGGMLMLAGISLPLLSLLNDLIDWNKPRFSKGGLITSASLLVSGFAISLLATKKCEIGEKYALEILIF